MEEDHDEPVNASHTLVVVEPRRVPTTCGLQSITKQVNGEGGFD